MLKHSILEGSLSVKVEKSTPLIVVSGIMVSILQACRSLFFILKTINYRKTMSRIIFLFYPSEYHALLLI
jgi:hypothetical protein